MGWLHEGHRSLMRQARADSATTVATIFVNPRQFNESSDYTRYPRNEARDLAICEEEGVDLVFAPPVEEVYPPGFDTVVSVGATRSARVITRCQASDRPIIRPWAGSNSPLSATALTRASTRSARPRASARSCSAEANCSCATAIAT